MTEALDQAKQDAVAEGKPPEAYARDYWIAVRQPPKCLADILEAYIGAIFVDSGYDFSLVQAFFNKHVLPYFADMHIYDTFASKHPVTFASTLLHEKFACHGLLDQFRGVARHAGQLRRPDWLLAGLERWGRFGRWDCRARAETKCRGRSGHGIRWCGLGCEGRERRRGLHSPPTRHRLGWGVRARVDLREDALLPREPVQLPDTERDQERADEQAGEARREKRAPAGAAHGSGRPSAASLVN